MNKQSDLLLPDLEARVARVRNGRGCGRNPPTAGLVVDPFAQEEVRYSNVNERLAIDFSVGRVEFPEIEVMDPRIVRISPGRRNERHKHAHESIFVVLAGVGELQIEKKCHPIRQGEVAFVPRWYFHQTRNTSTTETLVLLAITDFGLTSAVLGDYDRGTRMSSGSGSGDS